MNTSVGNITAQEPANNPLLERSKISLTEIRADQRAQPRDHLDTELTNNYAEEMRNGTVFPPLTVFFDGDAYWLADGFHRHYAALGAGLKEFACEIRHGGLREAILYSCGANAAHGYRRSNEDKRRAVRRMLDDLEWRQWSDREIARRCQVGHNLVGEVRVLIQPEVPVTGASTSENAARTYTTKHGITSKMDTSAIGKPNGGSSRKGPYIKTVDGESVSDMIRRGLALEAAGSNADKAAKTLGVDSNTYRQARDIVLLADRSDLGVTDAALTREALSSLDESRQCRLAHEKIKGIAQRVWGKQGAQRNSAREAWRLEVFEDAITIIVDVCDRSKEIHIPHLSREKVESTAEQLKRAGDRLRALKARIEDSLK